MVYTTEEAEKDIVSFDQALELCSIGFNKSTFCHYTIETRQLCLSSLDEEGLYMPDKDIAAPTKSQVFRWFRENYNLRGFIGFRPNVKKFDYHIYDMSLSGEEYVKQRTMEEFNKDPLVGTYEEAENACIDKLIELAKQQDK